MSRARHLQRLHVGHALRACWAVALERASRNDAGAERRPHVGKAEHTGLVVANGQAGGGR